MTDIKEDIHSSSAELPRDILLRQVMLNLLFHEIFILILFPYRSGGWKKVCLDGSYIAKCQITNTSFSVLMFQDNLWRSGKCYINYLIFGASFNGLLFMDIVYCLLYIVFI